MARSKKPAPAPEAEEMIVKDVYLRFDDGPVQTFRAWDVPRFVQSAQDRGRDSKPPYSVALATRAEYLREGGRK